jgi:uncharacterized protein (DUF3820 family)
MTINIHGKPYVEVKDRVTAFRQDHPEWAITTKLLQFDAPTGVAVIKAIVKDTEGRKRATGIAHEFQGDKTSMVNATSYVENCETSAIGRALACLGYGIEESYASANEVEGAIAKQQAPKPKQSTSQSSANWEDAIVPIGKNQGKRLGDLPERSRAWYYEKFEPNAKYPDSVAFRNALNNMYSTKPDETFQEESSQIDEQVPDEIAEQTADNDPDLDEDVPF